MDANMAREMVAKNEKRNKIIANLIAETDASILRACENGERNSIIHDKERYWGETYIEVHEHFKNKGFELKRYSDGSGYYLTW